MISNQILQNTIDGLKTITRTDLCVIDVEGKILAATFQDADKFIAPAQSFVSSPADSQVVGGCQFFKVFDDNQLEYVLLVKGGNEDIYMIGKIATFQIQVLFREFRTWQGRIVWKEQNQEASFRSVLELMQLLDEILGS